MRGMLVVLVLVAGCLAGLAASGGLRLPAVIGDNMVVQRGTRVPIWGWATPGERVVVRIAGQQATAKTGADGAWQVRLRPLNAAGPYEMTVSGATATLTVKNILAGEVWLCSGQSNMQMATYAAQNAAQEIAAANYPQMRLFVTGYAAVDTPQQDCTGQWVVCSPQTVAGFSAVAYFFGRALHQELHAPVGLILSAVGGTPAESWTSERGLLSRPELQYLLERRNRSLVEYPAAKKQYDEDMANPARLKEQDAQCEKNDAGWEAPSFDDAAWPVMAQPQQWETFGLQIDGVMWVRRTVQIPDAWAGKDLQLHLGVIDDQDVTYFNGVKVGHMGTETTEAWLKPRVYTVPGALVKAGTAVLAVRVTDMAGAGGILGGPKMMYLAPAGQEAAAIPLAGPWKYAIAQRRSMPVPPLGNGNSWLPTGLFNGMIAPLAPYALRGVIWYQGESNADRACQYRTLFPTMITDWRAHWGQGNVPFLFVLLANYMTAPEQPMDNDWAELREAQLQALALLNTGMASAIDIGNPGDIHPQNKQEVGRRLALWALATTYGRKGEYTGPLYRDATITGNTVRIRFTHVDKGLVARDGILRQFAIAGADKKFVWATAVIHGDTVLVSSPQIPHPVAVRYAWASNPEGSNLYNTAGLPAAPFRTDDWAGLTDGRL